MSLKGSLDFLSRYNTADLTDVQRARISELALVGAQLAERRGQPEIANGFNALYSQHMTFCPELVDSGWVPENSKELLIS